jgi:hypothetical protein
MFDLSDPTRRDLAAGVVRVADKNPDIPQGIVTILKDFHLVALNPYGRLRLTAKGSQILNRIRQGDEPSTIQYS